MLIKNKRGVCVCGCVYSLVQGQGWRCMHVGSEQGENKGQHITTGAVLRDELAYVAPTALRDFLINRISF